MRTQVNLTCPGSRGSLTVLVGTAWQAGYGISHPANVGTCPLVLGALDERGNPLQPENDLMLQPGDSRKWYTPPEGAAQVVTVCVNDCNGSTTLEYDTPVS